MGQRPRPIGDGIDVFLSYCARDGEIAARVHDDLKRSGLRVWGFQDDGEFGVDFQREFRERLQSARCFCPLDSAHARRSKWIREEWLIARARAEEDLSFRIVPCLVQRSGCWRNRRFFRSQNQLAYVDLTIDYPVGIRALCETLDVIYRPLSIAPRDEEIHDVLSKLPLGRHDMRRLVDLYVGTRADRSAEIPDDEVARRRLQLIVDELQARGKPVPAVLRLYLGVLDGGAGKHESALKQFGKAAEKAPKDPRIRAALAGAMFFRHEYKDAAREYEEALDLILESGEYRPHVEEVVHNLCQVHLALGQSRRAASVLERFSDELGETHSWLAMHGRILLLRGQPADAARDLERARRLRQRQGETVELPLLIDLARCYQLRGDRSRDRAILKRVVRQAEGNPETLRSVAEQWIREGSADEGIDLLRRACNSSPQSLVVRAELASLLFVHGRHEEACTEARTCLQTCEDSPPVAPREAYYHGMMLFLLGDVESAMIRLSNAQGKDRVVGRWPSYEAILGNA